MSHQEVVAITWLLPPTILLLTVPAAMFTGILSDRVQNFLCGVANLMISAYHIWVSHNEFMASGNAALAAVGFWIWWRRGGGGNTRKRLRELGKKFQPVRRTAPVTS